jgi:hypothetical protein
VAGRLIGRLVRGAVAAALLLAAAGGLFVWTRAGAPGSVDLGDAGGPVTGRRVTAFTGDAPACRAALDRAGVRFERLAPVNGANGCGYADGVRFASGGSLGLAYRPAGLGVACPVAAAMAAWQWNSVQPASRALFGQRVAAIEHFGSYSCRRLYNRDAGAWSEHATADAVDVAGFVLADGRRISVVADWADGGPEAAFLRRVRDGACGWFATVLSPDYNAAHRDHLHLDQAARGSTGWRACR